MPSSANPLNLLTSAILCFCGMMSGVLGAAGLFGGGGEIWWVFLALLAASGMMFWAAVANVVGWLRATRRVAATRQAMLQAAYAPAPALPGAAASSPVEIPAHAAPAPARAPAPAPAAAMAPVPARARSTGPVMAHWTYEPAEWEAYNEREVRYRTSEALWLAVGITIVGTLLMGWSEGQWWLGLGLSAAVGALFGGIRLAVARSAHARNRAAGYGEVIIGPDAVLMNGRYHTLHDGRIWLGGVRCLDGEHPPILEFTVEWKTRGGITNEQVRVPVPRGREDEARAVAEALHRAHPPALPGAAAGASPDARLPGSPG